MAHGHHRSRRRSALLLGFTVEPDDVEQLAQMHTAFDPHYEDRHPRDIENDEGGYMDRNLDRWGDRLYRGQ